MVWRQEIAMMDRDLFHLHRQQQVVHFLHPPEGPLPHCEEFPSIRRYVYEGQYVASAYQFLLIVGQPTTSSMHRWLSREAYRQRASMGFQSWS